MSRIQVVIVGAGIAGLGAAQLLCQSDCVDVTVLEAHGQAGGRIRTYRDEDGVLDLGANWVHGTIGNPIDKIAREENLYDKSFKHLHPNRYKRLGFLEDGSAVDSRLINQVFSHYRKSLTEAEDIFKTLPKLHRIKYNSTDVSIAEFCERRFHQWLRDNFKEGDPKLDICRRIFSHRMDYETLVSGTESMDLVSSEQFGSYDENDGPQPIVPNGYQTICEALLKRLPPETVKYNHQVKNIIWSQKCRERTESQANEYDGTSVNSEQVWVKRKQSNTGRTIVFLECENGESFRADFVILTCSLNYLKENHALMFDPALPEDKIRSMEKLTMGVVDKIILQFENLDFLPKGAAGLMLFRDRISVDANNLENTWYQKIGSFHVVDRFQNSLIAWLTGKAAVFAESLPDEEVAKTLAEVLRQFLQNPSVPSPKRVIRTAWHNDPYIRGSYTFIPVGSTVADIHDLSQPVCCPVTNQPQLFFAGEATHISKYSTTHGAFLSGEREAAQILYLISAKKGYKCCEVHVMANSCACSIHS